MEPQNPEVDTAEAKEGKHVNEGEEHQERVPAHVQEVDFAGPILLVPIVDNVPGAGLFDDATLAHL